MKKFLDGAGFREGFFLLTGISFCSMIAGHRLPTYLAAAVLLWGCLVIGWRILHIKEEKKMPLLWGCFLFLGSYALSAGMNMAYGITGNLKAFLWMAFEFLLLYGAKQKGSWDEERRDLKVFGGVVIVFTAVQALISLGMLIAAHQGVSPSGIYIGVWEGRLWGSYTDPNYGAILAVVSMVFTAAALIFSFVRGRLRVGLYLNLALQYLYLVFSYSRSGQICMILAAVVVILYLFFWGAKHSRGRVCILGICILILCFGGDVFRGMYNTLYADVEFQQPYVKIQESLAATEREAQLESQAAEAETSLSGTVSSETAAQEETEAEKDSPLQREDELSEDVSNGRFGIWKDGVRVWRSSPIYGISYRNISPYIQQNMPDSYLLDRQNALNTFHNMAVDVLVSQGLIGVVLLLVMIVGILKRSVNLLLHLEEEKRGIAAFLGIIVLTVCAGSMFLTDIFYINSPTAIVFWCCLGWLMRMQPETV